jgi:D-glycero-alpha-D-manno-heptose-7-phosphate kinase
MLVRARAPLRLSFGGGGTELSPYLDNFGGQVLNSTINLHAYATLSPSPDGKVHFIAADKNESVSFDPVPVLKHTDSLPLHCGVYNRIVRDYNNNKPLPVTLTTYCEAPIGSGLGSSSTLTVAMIKAFDEYLSLALGEYDLAHFAYMIERVDLGLSGGLQDQYSAAFGGFNFIEFHALDHVIVNPLRVRKWVVAELEASLILYYTGTSRKSAELIEAQTKKLDSSSQDHIERLHRIKALATEMKTHLLKGDVENFGRTLDHSWTEKRQISSSISNSTIDRIYQRAKDNGVVGGKITGAGGGGFMMLLCDPARRMDVLRVLGAEEGKIFSCGFLDHGAESWRMSGSAFQK